MRDVRVEKGIEPTETEVKEKLKEGSNMLLNRIIQLEQRVYGYDTSSYKAFKEKLENRTFYEKIFAPSNVNFKAVPD